MSRNGPPAGKIASRVGARADSFPEESGLRLAQTQAMAKTKRKKTKSSSRKSKNSEGGHGRGIWKGALSFGLVNIPVYLESANEEEKLHFHMIDKRDHAPIGYKQINKKTGRAITRDQITKGYEYKKGSYVLLSEADFKKANVKATGAIDIEDFVDLEDLDPMMFERPYYIIPQKGGEKGYALLRRTLDKTGKVAIAKIVLHTVQRLVAILPREDHLVLEIMRFANEVKEIHEVKPLPVEVTRAKISERELAGAEQLVESMSSQWNPDKYKNTYRDDLMKLIKSRVSRGTTAKVAAVEEAPPEVEETPSNVVDLTALLKRSIGTHRRSAHH